MRYYTIFAQTIIFTMAEKALITDVRDDIISHLKFIERDMAWLQKKTEIPYSTLYSIFTQRNFALNQERLDLINAVLETEFSLQQA